MKEQELQPNNPYTLFLILILLILATNPYAEEKLEMLNTMVRNTQDSIRTFKAGFQTFQTNFMSGGQNSPQ